MEEANSGYGTDGELMTHFTYENGVKNVDYKVDKSHANWANPSENGMEGFYTTLKDIKPTVNQTWTKSGNIYKSSDEALKKAFKAFTAPCFVGFEDVPNYITFDHVEIEEKNNTLELRLYTVAGDTGKLSSGSTLFSKAVISNALWTLPGSFNEWNQEHYFNMTDIGAVSTETLSATTYTFKVKYLDSWYSGAAITNTCKDVAFSTSTSADCSLKIETAGKYRFIFNTTTKKLTIEQA